MAPQPSKPKAKNVHLTGAVGGAVGGANVRDVRSSILKKKSSRRSKAKLASGKLHGLPHSPGGLGYKGLPSPGNSSALWNAMVYPFLNMTIYGAIWYEGGADALNKNYNCTFPAMIDDWRAKWYASTDMKTEKLFPFGFVQVCDKY